MPEATLVIIGVVVVLAIIIFMCNYVKVPPNVALIVSGRKHKYKVKDEGVEGSDEWTKGYNFTPEY